MRILGKATESMFSPVIVRVDPPLENSAQLITALYNNMLAIALRLEKSRIHLARPHGSHSPQNRLARKYVVNYVVWSELEGEVLGGWSDVDRSVGQRDN